MRARIVRTFGVERALVAAATFAALMTTVVSASAEDEDKKEAKRLFDQGRSSFINQGYAEAAADFRASVDLFPTHNGYYNLANCHKALRQYTEALSAIAEMRQRLPEAPRPEMQEKFEALERSIRAIAGTLNLAVAPDGVDIFIDGKPLGKSPLTEPVPLPTGYHAVECELKGFKPLKERVLVVAGEESSLRLSLAPLPAEVSLAVNIDGADVAVDGRFAGKTPLHSPLLLPPGDHVVAVSKLGYEPESRNISPAADERVELAIALVPLPVGESPLTTKQTAVPSDDRKEKSRPGVRRVLLWSGIAGAAASAAGFAVFMALAANLEDSFQANDAKYVASSDESEIERYDEARREDRDRGIGFSRAAMGFGIAAGVFAAGTTIVVLVLDEPESNEHVVSAVPGALQVRF